jgi:hypothetical protein
MTTDLNNNIVTYFNTASGQYAEYLRDNSNGIFLNVAPQATPQPYIVFSNKPGSNEQNMCSNLYTIPVDLEIYSTLAIEGLTLAYNLQKLYDKHTFQLDEPNVNVSTLYNNTWQNYDFVNEVYVTTISLNYSVAVPQGMDLPDGVESFNLMTSGGDLWSLSVLDSGNLMTDPVV